MGYGSVFSAFSANANFCCATSQPSPTPLCTFGIDGDKWQLPGFYGGCEDGNHHPQWGMLEHLCWAKNQGRGGGRTPSQTPFLLLVPAFHGQLEHLESISGRSRRDCAYLHREFKQLITKAIFFFYYYFLQTKLINQITQDAHYAKLN